MEELNGLPTLPTSWTWSSIGKVIEPVIEQSAPEGDAEFIYVDISSIDNKKKVITEPKRLLMAEAPSRAKQRLQPGDVLVSMTRPNLNAVAQLPESLCGSIGSTGFCVLRTKWVPPSWLYFLVQTNDFIGAMSLLVQGALYPAVRPKDIMSYPLPVAPLPEQRRIVAKIEELFTKLDVGVASLKAAKKQLKRYRQSVLKAAIEGELTREWREQHKNELEPASVLLERILRERREKWEADQLARMKAQGKMPKDDKWKAKYQGPIIADSVGLTPVPHQWVHASLEALSKHIVDCLHSTPLFTSKGKYCIDTTCIAPGKILFDEARFVTEETYEQRVQRLVPRSGDILFSREGTIGTAVMVPENVELCLGQRMMMFRPAEGIVASYLMWSLLSPSFRRQWEPKVGGSTSPHLNIGDIKAMALPLPYTKEQQQIVSEVERRFSVTDEIEAALDAELKRAECLRQSILKRAFEGKLVPQDPKDEPASVLLKRIEAEEAQREDRDTPHHNIPRDKGPLSKPKKGTTIKD